MRKLKLLSHRAKQHAAGLRLPRGWTAVGLAAGAALLLFGNKGFRAMAGNFLSLRRLERQASALSKEEAELKARIEAAKKDDLALERAVRRELGFQRPGEIEYRFPPPPPES